MYATDDNCIRVLDGYISLRWWYRKIKTSIEDGNKKCRLKIQLNGLEFMVYNNSTKYNHLEKIIAKRNGNSFEDYNNELKETIEKPWIFRFVPAIAISMKRGCIYIGNPHLPKIAVTTFQKSKGIYTITRVHHLQNKINEFT